MKTKNPDTARNLELRHTRRGAAVKLLQTLVCLAGAFAPLALPAQTILRRETFEDANAASDDWYADNGAWQIGVPTAGPAPNAQGRRAYAGTNCSATVLGGNYGNNMDSRLIWDPLQPLVIPPADQHPRLRFVAWMDAYAGDYGRVLIRTNGGAWNSLSGDFYGPGQAWNQTVLDLSVYANKAVQVAFLFHSDGANVAAGWYVDEVTLVAGPVVPVVPNVAESFEAGWGDWSVEGGGPWELGRPTSGPGSAHQGSNCVATTLGGNYPERSEDFSVYSSRLASPAVVVPPAGSNPRLRFWHYYSFNLVGPDYGEVQIKVGTNAWQMLAHYAGNSSGVWTRPSFDLSAYAGQTVSFGFLFSHRNVDGNSSVN